MPKIPEHWRRPTRQNKDERAQERATTIVLSAIILLLIGAILMVLEARGFR